MTNTYLNIGDSHRGNQQVNGKKTDIIMKFWPNRDSPRVSQQVNAKMTDTYFEIGDSRRGSQQVNGKKNGHYNEILALLRFAASKSTSQRKNDEHIF